MRELHRAKNDALRRIERLNAVGIPGSHFSIEPGLTFQQWYWLDRLGLVPAKRQDDNQQWYGFILGYMPTSIMAFQNEIYFSFPRGQIGVRAVIRTDESPIHLITQSRRLANRHYEDLVEGLIAGLQLVGLSESGTLPLVETPKFKDFVREHGRAYVTNHTSMEL